MTHQNNHPFADCILNGDCIEALKKVPDETVDLVVTDPPYIVNYKDRSGRSIMGDDNGDWLKPAFAQIHRVLKNHAFCISFYGWNEVDKFMSTWKDVGFKPVGHLVWHKHYASNSRYLNYRHEQAFLLAKGDPPIPVMILDDIHPWTYSGNGLHPNQKSVEIIKPLIRAFSKEGDLVLDPFAGSGTTALSAKLTGRQYMAIEKDFEYYDTARRRLIE